MTVKILFFGATADTVGSREVEIDHAEGRPVGSLVESLTAEHPRLSSHKLLIAVNEQYTDADTILKDGDEVAVFTAVSGG